MTSPKYVPARILVQVREGVPNLLADFELTVYETRPLDPSDPDTLIGAKLGHTIEARDILGGLALAQRKLIQEARAEGKLAEADEQWLRGLFEWVMEP